MGRREWILIVILGVMLGISAASTFRPSGAFLASPRAEVDLALGLPVGILAMLIVVFGFGRFVKRLTG